MRDYAILGFIIGSLPLCFLYPYYGVLMWYWIAYFSPHRYGWGPAYHFPVAQIVALPTLAGLFFSKQLNRGIFVRETVLLLFLWVWFSITLLNCMYTAEFSGHVADAQFQMVRVSKILLMTAVTILVVTSREKLRFLSMVTAASFGLLAIKGTVFGLKTSGGSRVWGPPDSFIADNNDMALAMNMSLPLLYFLARNEERRWLRLALYATFYCGIVTVLLTYSRGGLLGLGVVVVYVAIMSKHRFFALGAIAAGVLVALTFAPAKWTQRMSTLTSGQLDDTAMQRVITWEFGWNFVQHYPITGGGFEVFPDVSIFQRYALRQLPGGVYQAASPHSIYFQVLGEHGFVGFLLYASLLLSSLYSLRKMRRRAKRVPALSWMVTYADMFTGSLLAYMISGTFLSRAYFDFFYQLIASVIIMKILFKKEVLELLATKEVAEPEPVPALEESVPVEA